MYNPNDAHPLDARRAELGTRPDAEIADAVGVTVEEVKAYRRAHGIAPHRRPPPGTQPAAPTARRRDAAVVRRRDTADGGRETRRVMAAEPVATSAVVAAEAAEPTATVAAKAGASRAAAAKLAPTKGTTTTAAASKAAANRAAAAVSRAEAMDTEAAPTAAAPPPTNAPGAPDRSRGVGRRRATAGVPPPRPSVLDAWRHLFGSHTDDEIAEIAEVTRGAVFQYRKRRGIASLGRGGAARRAKAAARSGRAKPGATARAEAPPRLRSAAPATREVPAPPVDTASPASPAAAASADRPKRRGTSKLLPFLDLVGVLPDADVAARAGVTRMAVALYRHRHGIAPAARTTRGRPPGRTSAAPSAASAAPVTAGAPTTPTPTAPTPLAEPAAVRAFYVTARSPARERTFVAVGGHLLEAIEGAHAALGARPDGPWLIVAVRRGKVALA